MTHSLYDETSPIPSDDIKDAPSKIRGIRSLVKERLALDHNMNDVLDTTLPTADGYHNKITMPDFNFVDEYNNTLTEPDLIDDAGQFFIKEINGIHELCYHGNMYDDNGNKLNSMFQYTEKGGACVKNISTIYRDGATQSFGACSFKGNIYICSGANIKKSIDNGLTFNIVLTASYVFYDICVFNNLLVTCGSYGVIYTSSDGSTWIDKCLSAIVTNTFIRMQEANNKLFLFFLTQGGGQVRLEYTNDGSTFNDSGIIYTDGNNPYQHIEGIVYKDGTYYASLYNYILSSINTLNSRLLVSSNLTTWENKPVLTMDFSKFNYTTYIFGLAYSYNIIYSTRLKKLIIPFGVNLSDINNMTWYSAGFLLSNDGNTWTSKMIDGFKEYVPWVPHLIETQGCFFAFSKNHIVGTIDFNYFSINSCDGDNYGKLFIHNSELYGLVQQSGINNNLIKIDRSI